MLRGLGQMEGSLTTPACSATDSDFGFMYGLTSWLPLSYTSSTGGTGIPWSTVASGNLQGLFEPSVWVCQPLTQIGILILPAAAIIGAAAIFKRSRRR
jgi:hypothetical protein